MKIMFIDDKPHLVPYRDPEDAVLLNALLAQGYKVEIRDCGICSECQGTGFTAGVKA